VAEDHETCTYQIKKGSEVRLLATSDGTSTDWADSFCAAEQLKSSATSARGDLTLQSSTSVKACSFSVVRRAPREFLAADGAGLMPESWGEPAHAANGHGLSRA
jgi:hypothetical protein